MNNPWEKVVFADELPICQLCEEPFCPECDAHYYECQCMGPTEDNVEYKEEDGVLYGRRLNND